jgi:hypothetical protein
LLLIENTALNKHGNEGFLRHLQELFELDSSLSLEDASQKKVMLVEHLTVIVRVEFTNESVLHHPLLKLNVTRVEHVFQDVLQGTYLFLKTLSVQSVVSCTDDAL